jgi:hypothetical protein
MADLHVAHASSPLAIHTSVRPPEPKKGLPNPPQTPKADDSHGPAVVFGGAFAKPPVKPASGAQGSDNNPSPFAPPKPGSDKTAGPGQHFNHVI